MYGFDGWMLGSRDWGLEGFSVATVLSLGDLSSSGARVAYSFWCEHREVIDDFGLSINVVGPMQIRERT